MSKYKHISIDIETLGNSPRSKILSIGATAFNTNVEWTKSFYATFTLDDQQDRTMNHDTFLWWMSADDAAREFLSSNEGMLPFKEGLEKFALWIKKYCTDDVGAWGNGATFDIAILEDSYKSTGLEVPWKFWNGRCLRTLIGSVQLLDSMFDPKKDIKFVGVRHNACDDATHQAEIVKECYKVLQLHKISEINSVETIKDNRMIIGLGCQKRVGKDTVADILVKDFGFTSVSFAAPLKELADWYSNSGWVDDPSEFYFLKNWENKYGELSPSIRGMLNGSIYGGWHGAEMPAGALDECEEGKPRALLQWLGTDVIRAYKDTFWIDALRNNLPKDGPIVVTDIRFLNEVEAVREFSDNSLVVKVTRRVGMPSSDSHSSETGLPQVNWDYVLGNNCPLDYLANTQVPTMVGYLENLSDGR